MSAKVETCWIGVTPPDRARLDAKQGLLDRDAHRIVELLIAGDPDNDLEWYKGYYIECCARLAAEQSIYDRMWDSGRWAGWVADQPS